MKRRSAHAIEKSTRGKKAAVRKLMLYYSGQETMMHALRTYQHIQFAWMRADNREIVKSLQHIENIFDASHSQFSEIESEDTPPQW